MHSAMNTELSKNQSVTPPCSSSAKGASKIDIGAVNPSITQALAAGAEGLTLVENRIRSQFAADAPVLTQISDYLLSLGGKRIRPLLSVLSGRLFGMYPPSEWLIDAAAGIELIHMATLLHDDIIDQSPTRRNSDSAYRRYGLSATLLTGDFLLVRAFGLCSHLDSYVINATERACVALTEGEVLEGHLKADAPLDIEDYLNIIGKKTASLFSLATAVGAHLSGADEASVKTMADFGYQTGLSFQMIDDILDVTADESLLGKPSGTDLRQQTPSLVNVLWLQSQDPKAAEFFSETPATAEQARRAVEFLRGSPIVEKSRHYAISYATRARDLLCSLPSDTIEKAVQEHLLSIVDYTLARCV